MSDQSRTEDAYARAGVDIAAGNEAVARYKRGPGRVAASRSARRDRRLRRLFRLPGGGDRALVASADGVGTKILIAAELQRYDGVGRDLVNHCVNDILVVNATPMFFLDYFAVGKLDPAVAAEVVAGCAQACRAHECALLGGETAEMPGLYAPGHFDLAGTIVGIVDIDEIPKPKSVERRRCNHRIALDRAAH